MQFLTYKNEQKCNFSILKLHIKVHQGAVIQNHEVSVVLVLNLAQLQLAHSVKTFCLAIYGLL